VQSANCHGCAVCRLQPGYVLAQAIEIDYEQQSEVSNRVLSGKSFVPACKYILTRWYVCPRVVNPSSGLGGLEGRQKMSVILSVCLSVRLSVPGSLARVASPQTSVPSPFLFPPELSWWAGITCRVYGLLY